VVLLGWNEIVRRATLDPNVADKHFGPAGGGAPRSPLLTTWMMSNGRLEKTGEELVLSVKELAQDFHDWPTGHIVIGQRESDAIIENLRLYEGRDLPTEDRKTRIALRKNLRELTDAEERAASAIKLMLTDPEVSIYFLQVWEDETPLAIEAFVNNELRPKWFVSHSENPNPIYLRMSPPNDPNRRCSTLLSSEEVAAIHDIKSERQQKYGNPLTDTVGQLPDEVRARKALPRIMRGLFEFMSAAHTNREDRLTWDQIRRIGALDIGDWKVSVA
jgi:hypothetical protein